MQSWLNCVASSPLFFHSGQSLFKVKVNKNYDEKINRATSTGVSYLPFGKLT